MIDLSNTEKGARKNREINPVKKIAGSSLLDIALGWKNEMKIGER